MKLSQKSFTHWISRLYTDSVMWNFLHCSRERSLIPWPWAQSLSGELALLCPLPSIISGHKKAAEWMESHQNSTIGGKQLEAPALQMWFYFQLLTNLLCPGKEALWHFHWIASETQRGVKGLSALNKTGSHWGLALEYPSSASSSGVFTCVLLLIYLITDGSTSH